MKNSSAYWLAFADSVPAASQLGWKQHRFRKEAAFVAGGAGGALAESAGLRHACLRACLDAFHWASWGCLPYFLELIRNLTFSFDSQVFTFRIPDSTIFLLFLPSPGCLTSLQKASASTLWSLPFKSRFSFSKNLFLSAMSPSCLSRAIIFAFFRSRAACADSRFFSFFRSSRSVMWSYDFLNG